MGVGKKGDRKHVYTVKGKEKYELAMIKTFFSEYDIVFNKVDIIDSGR